MPAWEKRKSEEAAQSQGRRAVRQAVAEGGSEREVLRRLVDVLATLSLVNAAELRDLTSQDIPGPKLGKRGRRNGRATTPLAQSRTSPKQSAQTFKSSSVPPFVYVWVAFLRILASTKELGGRTRGSSEAVLGEQRVEERSSAVGIARSVLQSEAVQESRGQGRVDAHCVLPGPDHPPPRGSTGGSIAAAPRQEAPLEREAARLLTQMRVKWSAQHAETSQRMAELLRPGCAGAVAGVCLPDDKGRSTDSTGQIQ